MLLVVDGATQQDVQTNFAKWDLDAAWSARDG